MKATIIYKNDEIEVHENCYPSISSEDSTLVMCDMSDSVLTDDILIEDIKQLIWEP